MSRTLTQRPSDLTGLGNRFLAILLMKAGLGLSPIKVRESVGSGVKGATLFVGCLLLANQQSGLRMYLDYYKM